MAECAKCGRKIHWGISITGAKIPLDMTSPVYRLDTATNAAVKETGYYVSHFCTCKFADEFSGGNKGEKPVDDDAKKARNAELLDFIRALDCAVDLPLSEWERDFVGNIIERDEKYHGNVFFSPAMIVSVEKMQKKYADQVRLPGNTKVTPPAKSSFKTRPPPARAQAPAQRDMLDPPNPDADDNIPF